MYMCLCAYTHTEKNKGKVAKYQCLMTMSEGCAETMHWFWKFKSKIMSKYKSKSKTEKKKSLLDREGRRIFWQRNKISKENW